ncbi:YopX family protein [Bacillus inaquosorum]|uniref:YopX family protein n=1 Tax=Bacillus inaquosorum TaxID=483913 RepID=UPI0022803FB5|nr:YopX family protein [Bacillus inaquosorum]MCY7785295.1 YopX family protein [Bacillus inaquosorum]
MREIKFRGMGINGEWYYGNLSIIKQRIKSMGIDPGSYISNKAGVPFAYKVRPETVGQFTGLKDKSEAGQEVWEGDIRKDVLGRIFKVVYDNDLAAFYGEYTNGHYESLGDCGPDSEFLGTVYQNPELLEAAE